MSDDIVMARILARAADENYKAAVRMQAAAELIARSVECMADVEGYGAANQQRAHHGSAVAYDDEAFFALAAEHRIDEESVRDLLGPARGSQREDLPDGQ